MGQINSNTKNKGLSLLIAVLFTLNLLSVLPINAYHVEHDGVTHSVTIGIEDFSHEQDRATHDSAEHCGMASCSVTLSKVIGVTDKLNDIRVVYVIVSNSLSSISHTPPGRPPLA